jgi:hypothetical protein
VGVDDGSGSLDPVVGPDDVGLDCYSSDLTVTIEGGTASGWLMGFARPSQDWLDEGCLEDGDVCHTLAPDGGVINQSGDFCDDHSDGESCIPGGYHYAGVMTYGDVWVGAYGEGTSGAACLVYGPVSGTFDLASADAKIVGDLSGDSLGSALHMPGDVDGDGHDDVIVVATGEDSGASGAGALYLLTTPVSGTVSAQAEARILGEDANDNLGAYGVSSGDVDGDGAGTARTRSPRGPGSRRWGAPRTRVQPGCGWGGSGGQAVLPTHVRASSRSASPRSTGARSSPAGMDDRSSGALADDRVQLDLRVLHRHL